MVSHDRELLDVVDHIGEMRDGAITFFGGNFTTYTEALDIEQGPPPAATGGSGGPSAAAA